MLGWAPNGRKEKEFTLDLAFLLKEADLVSKLEIGRFFFMF